MVCARGCRGGDGDGFSAGLLSVSCMYLAQVDHVNLSS